MSTNLYKLTDAQLSGACTYPATGERLSEYLADPLESPAAKEVEEHLLDCRHCREFFLTILSMRGEARMAQITPDGEIGRQEQNANVLEMAYFKKG
jgi:predicted anti-sigma-YlaC factor YlaD